MDYRRTIRELSERIVAAQMPIRVLDAVKWDDGVRQAFFAAGCKHQPPVDRRYYEGRPLGFDGAALRAVFTEIDRDVAQRLGRSDPAAMLMHRACHEYLRVLDLLDARGTDGFTTISQQLYGRSGDAFHAGGPSLTDLAELLDASLRNIDESAFLTPVSRDLSTQQAVVILQERLDRVFSEPDARVRVCESDGIIADAASGSDYIKLRTHASFSERELGGLEAHEGWVHVGTTLNGRAQPVCTFLGKGTPSTTITQEGLALFVEVITLRSHPARLRRVTDRIRAIRMAEEGATFLEVFERLCGEGWSPEDAYGLGVRVFRGSTPEGGPFTKDLAYSRGFILAYNFIRLAVHRGRLDRIPLLFCGKIAIEQIGILARLADGGIVTPARHLPPPLADLHGLAAWMAYSNFLNRLDLSRMDAEFVSLLA